MKKIFLSFKKSWDIWVFIILFISVFWTSRFFLSSDCFYSHDLDYNLARGLEAFQSIKLGNIPLRWAGNINNGCGVPVFNFFYPLGYYLLASFYFLTGSVLLSWKLLVLICLFIGSWFFYLWGKESIGDRLSSFIGSFIYLFAPYRFLLVFVRGSLEFLAYAIFPILLFLFFRFLRERKNKKELLYSFLLSFAGALFILSHNIVVMVMLPIFLLIIIFELIKGGLGKRKFLLLSFSFLSMFGLSSFFVGPALLEKKYVKLGYLNIVNYKDHFPTLFQLIRSRWGYFFSVAGENDGMSFMLGYAQWFVLLISVLVIFYLFFSGRDKIKSFLSKRWLFFYLLLSFFTIFLILPQSSFIWDKIGILSQVQYPWRLIGVAVFAISALSVYLFSLLKKNFVYWLLFFITLFLAFFGNRNHLRVLNSCQGRELLYKNFVNHYVSFVGTTTIADEILSLNSLSACFVGDKFIISDEVSYDFVSRNALSGVFKLSLGDKKPEKLIFSLEYFPGAYVFEVNGKENIPYQDCSGRVCIDGKEFSDYSLVSWHIVQTPIQKFFNYLSLFFLIVWFLILAGLYKKKNIVFILILGLFLFFRFYQIDKRLLFGWDQERDAFTVKSILEGNLTLLGPRVVGSSGFFLPPYFFYVLSPFYLLFKGNPLVSLVLFLFFYLVSFFLASYFLLSKIFSSRVSYLFLIIWSILPAGILIDRIVWNPLLVPLFFILIIYLFYKYLQSKKIYWFWILSTVYFLGISFHIQLAFYLLFLVLALFVGGKEPIFKKLLIVLLSFLVVFLPLIIFDFRHNFLNLKLIMNAGNFGLDRGGMVEVWNNFVSMVFGFRFSFFFSSIFYFLILFLSSALYKIENDVSRKKVILGMILVLLLAFIIFAFVYPFRPSEYYFNFVLPLFVLVFSLWIDRLLRKKLILLNLVLVFILVFFFKHSLNFIGPDTESIYFKEKLISSLKAVSYSRASFDISLDFKEGRDAGFYYLLNFNRLSYNKRDGSALIRIVSPSYDKCQISVYNYSICFNPVDFGW